MATAEYEFYAASSGLPRTATLEEHRAAVYRAALPGEAATDTLQELEGAWLRSLVADVPEDTLQDLRFRYFASVSGLTVGTLVDHMAATFAGGGSPPPPDVTSPTAGTLAGSNVTATSFDLTISGAADETALHATPYAFSTDNGASWSAFQASPVFAATGMAAATGYTCKGRVRDAAGNSADTAGVLVTTGAAPGATISFLQNVASTFGQTEYTFAAQPLGPEDTNRRIIVVVHGRDLAVVPTCTLGGVAMVMDEVAAITHTVTIFSLVVPTGATADVVVTFPSLQSWLGIGMWAITGAATTAVATAETSANSATPAASVVTQAGDMVIAGLSYRVTVSGSSVAWNDPAAVERYDGAGDGLVRQYAGADIIAVDASTDVGATITNYGAEATLCAVAYRA
jgi:hypothetical protein